MSKPKTLRSLAGKDSVAPSLAESALVMIDCQNTYCEGVMKLEGIEAAMAEASAVLARARAAGTPVIHVAHDGGSGSLYDYSAEIGAIADPVAPEGEEQIVVKNFPNSFHNTDLHDKLQALGRSSVIFTGFMTHMCVNSTVRAAFNLGYQATVVADATATRALPATDGGSAIDAATLHRASLAAISDLFGNVIGNVDKLRA